MSGKLMSANQTHFVVDEEFRSKFVCDICKQAIGSEDFCFSMLFPVKTASQITTSHKRCFKDLMGIQSAPEKASS